MPETTLISRGDFEITCDLGDNHPPKISIQYWPEGSPAPIAEIVLSNDELTALNIAGLQVAGEVKKLELHNKYGIRPSDVEDVYRGC